MCAVCVCTLRTDIAYGEFCRNAFDSVELLVETIHVHCNIKV